MNRRLLVGGLAACAGLFAISGVVQASHSWGSYHWARTTPQFTLKLGNNMSSDWASYLFTTSADWNAGNSAVLTAVVNGTSNRRCSAVSGTTQVCNGKYGNNGWLGLASINITGGQHITQGTAKMNDTYFNTATYNNPNEKLHVVCQEIAHTFGLGHTSEDGSSQNTCMDYFSNTGPNAGSTLSTKPNAHDFQQLNLIYAHLDTTTTLASGTGGGKGNSSQSDDPGGDPNAWGMLVSQTRNGRGSTYEQDHGGGKKTITHVYWTLEAAERCPSCDHRYDH